MANRKTLKKGDLRNRVIAPGPERVAAQDAL